MPNRRLPGLEPAQAQELTLFEKYLAGQREVYKRRVEEKLQRSREGVEAFAKSLVDNPAYALQWSDSIYLDGACVDLYSRIAGALARPEITLMNVYDTIERDFMSKTKFLYNRGSGVGANRYKDCEVSAYAEEVEVLKRILECNL